MKITPDHLARGAFIYIRQSTVDQLTNNHESRRRQYGLADRARALGWTDVTVIDDDLGRSGSGVSRPGFARLLAAICEGRVGAVFAIENDLRGTLRNFGLKVGMVGKVRFEGRIQELVETIPD